MANYSVVITNFTYNDFGLPPPSLQFYPMNDHLNTCVRGGWNTLLKLPVKITGVRPPDVLTIYHRRVNSKAQDILQCSDHLLHAEFEVLPSGRKFRLPKAKSNRLKNSFITQAITQLSETV